MFFLFIQKKSLFISNFRDCSLMLAYLNYWFRSPWLCSCTVHVSWGKWWNGGKYLWRHTKSWRESSAFHSGNWIFHNMHKWEKRKHYLPKLSYGLQRGSVKAVVRFLWYCVHSVGHPEKSVQSRSFMLENQAVVTIQFKLVPHEILFIQTLLDVRLFEN